MANSTWLGLDVGTRRVGVAIARTDVRIPQPLTTLANDAGIFTALAQLVKENEVKTIVVGLPRNLDGNETGQTKSTQNFVHELQSLVSTPIAWQDEATTSQKAEAELTSRKKTFEKAEVDALAATYILEDYINEHVRGSYV